MEEPDPWNQYASADAGMRSAIDLALKRRNQHKWFQNGMQVLGHLTGAGVAFLGLFYAHDLATSGEAGQIIAGSIIGTVDLAALAALFVNSTIRNRGLSETQTAPEQPQLPPGPPA